MREEERNLFNEGFKMSEPNKEELDSVRGV